jgi:hypothetical protein
MTAPSPSNDDLVQFLTAVGIPIVLTAIVPDGWAKTRTFSQFDDAAKWVVEQNNAGRNIYWTVNRTAGEVQSKPTKSQIVGIRWVHADIDPLEGKEFRAERERILSDIDSSPIKPTMVIDSGGGFQIFWRLVGSIAHEMDKNTDELELANRAMIAFFHGDSGTYNLDRIMRVPGTVNYPNKKKLGFGRKEAPAKLVSLGDDAYAMADILEAFPAPPQVTAPTKNKGSSPAAAVMPMVDLDIDALPISTAMKAIARDGKHPEAPDKYKKGTDRSAALWAVLVAMVSAGCGDAELLGVCLSPGLFVGGHCLDQKRPQVSAVYQVGRARAKAAEGEDPDLAVMNDKHAVVSEEGKTQVVNFEFDHVLDRRKLTRSTFGDLRGRYNNTRKTVGGRLVPKGNWWLGHPHRLQYDAVVFAPGAEVQPGSLNLWRGFAIEPKPGDWGLMRKHIHNVVCAGDDQLFHYLLSWLARAVQNPGVAGEVALVLRGGRGTGKGLFARFFGSLWGQHFLHLAKSGLVVGRFNDHLEDAVVVFADEAFFAGDRRDEGALKALITEEVHAVEAKYRPVKMVKNCVHLMMASNDEWVVPAGMDERRFFVLDVSAARVRDNKYFSALAEQMKGDGRAAMLHDLLELDLKEFDVRNVPQTTALREQKIHGLKPFETWFYDRLMDGRLTDQHIKWVSVVPTEDVYRSYAAAAGTIGARHHSGVTQLGMSLRKILPAGYPKKSRPLMEVPRPNGEGLVRRRVTCWTFPSLGLCRKHFNELTRTEHDWPKDDEEENELPLKSPHAVSQPTDGEGV